MVKSYWWVGVGARVYASLVILVSALGPRGLDLDLDQGLTILLRDH